MVYQQEHNFATSNQQPATSNQKPETSNSKLQLPNNFLTGTVKLVGRISDFLLQICLSLYINH